MSVYSARPECSTVSSAKVKPDTARTGSRLGWWTGRKKEEDGTTVIREKERFSNEVTAFAFHHAQRYALGRKPSREEEAPATLAEAGDSALRTSRIQARERNFDGSVRRAVEGEATAARPQRHAPNARGIHPRRKRGRCEDCRATRQDFAPI
jgi:hypothetical protein